MLILPKEVLMGRGNEGRQPVKNQTLKEEQQPKLSSHDCTVLLLILQSALSCEEAAGL